MNACRAIAVFLVCTVPSFAQDTAGPVAIVNGEAITRAEFDSLFARRSQSGIRQVGTQQKQLQQDVVAVLVDDLLLKQFLRTNAPPIDKADVERQLAALESALTAQSRTMADYLRETHQTRDQLRANVSAVLQWKTYALSKVTDAEMKQYFVDNKAFFDRARVRASHIVIRVPATAPAAEREAAKQKLAALREEIVARKVTFADAAIKNSQCPSAPKGGDLGYIPRKGMVDEAFAQAAFALPVGGISEVIATENAVRLVLVTDKKPGTAAFFEDPRIKADVKECAIEEMRQRLVADLRAKAKVEVKLP